MTTPEERMKILDMIRDGKIKPDEGARLIAALQTGSKATQTAAQPRNARWLRVRVSQIGTDKVKVNVNLPISVVNVGLKLGARLVPNGDIDFPAILQLVKEGRVGKVLELRNDEEEERIEVWLE